MDYELLCASPLNSVEIDEVSFWQLIEKNNTAIIDVRELNEMPAVTSFAHLQIPLGKINENLAELKTDTVVLFCQSGKRSLQAAKLLLNIYGANKNIYSLKGGIISLKKHN